MRLDSYLSEKGIYQSRTRAAGAIRAGCVSIGGKTVVKPSFDIDGIDPGSVTCLPDPLDYVGRGALKLEFALERFGINVEGLECIDVGASTGGFTEVLLRHGAKSVTAVDVGHGQLHDSLKKDSRVVNAEGTDIRLFSPGKEFDFLSADISFISLSLVCGKIAELLKPGAVCIVLFKPQFEVGKKAIGKGGIVRSQKDSIAAMEKIISDFTVCGLDLIGKDTSPVKGGDGNTEYLLCFKKNVASFKIL